MVRRIPNPHIPFDVADAMVEFFSAQCTRNENVMPLFVAVRAADDFTFDTFGFRIKDLFVDPV